MDSVKVQQTSAVKDPEKLLQDMDVNRLRAVIYRDVVSASPFVFSKNKYSPGVDFMNHFIDKT
jgi:hypothetical protein